MDRGIPSTIVGSLNNHNNNRGYESLGDLSLGARHVKVRCNIPFRILDHATEMEISSSTRYHRCHGF